MPDSGSKRAPRKSAGQPAWAEGLRRLYDGVLEEPLPDDLAALLARLDQDSAA